MLDSVGDRLLALDPRLVAAALLLHVGNHALRALAWRNVLAAAHPDSKIGYLRVAAAYAAGVALNAVAPARGGDAAKIALARASIPGSNVATLAGTMSVLVLFDLVAATVLVLVMGAFGAMPLAPSLPSMGGVAAHPLVALPAVLAVAGACILLLRLCRPRARRLWARVRQGGEILRTPAAYARRVVLPQASAWGCRVGVVMCLLAAFGLPASVPIAAVVMIVTGASTVVPLTPGGAGTQQVMLAFALSSAASATAVVSFSIGMQASITALNALLGVVAAMAMCRTLRPDVAIRATLRRARAQAVT
jgi:uncharacterized membrane protein YbhN (UPF0104 family)